MTPSLLVTCAAALALAGCAPTLDAATDDLAAAGPGDSAAPAPADALAATDLAAADLTDPVPDGFPDGGAPASDAARGASDAAVPKPVSGIFNVRDHGATGNGVADDTAAFAATIAAADKAGGGIVYAPVGRYRLKGNLRVASAITIAGAGFSPPDPHAPGTLAGSWLIVDAGFLHSAAVTLAGAGASLRDLGVWHEQPAPGKGWQPLPFGWAIDMSSPDTLVRNVWLANPTLGIHGTGRVTIENVQGEPITAGIRIEYAYDVVRIRRVRWNWTADGLPVWSSDPSVLAQLGTGIESLRDDNPEIYDLKLAGYSTGIHFGANPDNGGNPGGGTSKFSLMDTTIDGSQRCLTVDGPGSTGKLTRFWGKGCGLTGIWISGANSVVSAADLDLREIGANAIRVEAPGAALLVNQVTLVDWDLLANGFPAVEAAHAAATVRVGLFHTFMGKGPQTGGVGSVAVDGNPGDATFDLRVPAPTEVSEDGHAPFAAAIDVLQHGAAGDGKVDDTAAIQAALDAAAAAGGGPVLVPAGDYLIEGSLKVPAGVTLAGIGWNTSASRGARLLVGAKNASDVIVLGDRAALSSLAMHWDQGVVGPGFRPSGTFGWGVRVSGTTVVVRDLFLLNPTRGIRVESAGNGPVLLDRVIGSPLAVGLDVDTEAALRINDVHFWPFWGVCAGSPPNGCKPGTMAYDVNTPKEQSGVAYQLQHSAHAEVSNVFSIGYAVGVLLGQNGKGKANTDLRLWNADQDIFGARGYSVSGANTQAVFANWSCQGDNGTDTAITGLWAQPSASGARIDGYNGDLRIFGANGARSDAPGSTVRLNLMRIESFDLSGKGFPAVEASGGATVGAGPEHWGY